MRVAVVVSGGQPLEADQVADLGDDLMVVTADSGTDHAQAVGLPVHHVIGDLDSVSETGLRRAESAGATIHPHPIDKDQTDLELALELAAAHHPQEIRVLSGGGGRLDHLLSSALILASPRWAPGAVSARIGRARVTVIRHHAVLSGEPGETISLLAADGPAEGVTTSGLRYPLDDEPLVPGKGRGVSNLFETGRAEVTVRSGALLAIQPGE